MSYTKPIFVTRELYDTFQCYYPDCDERDIMLHKHLLLTGRHDSVVGGIIVSNRLLRGIFSHELKSQEALEQWAQRQRIDFDYIPGDRQKGKSGIVFAYYPDELMHIAQSEKFRIYNLREWMEDLVDFATGAQCTAKIIRTARQTYDNIIAKQMADPEHPAAELIKYLNGLSTKTQSIVIRSNMLSVNDAIQALPNGEMVPMYRKNGKPLLRKGGTQIMGPNRDMARLDHNRRCFRSMLTMPYVRYRSVGGTPRLYTDGVGPLSLSREIRNIAYRGCISADLKSAQLAILSALGNCDKLQSFLKSGKSWWSELIDYLGLLPEQKPILKTATYTICFGGDAGYIKYLLHKGDLDAPGMSWDKAHKFFEHPLVSELMINRDRMIDKIVQDGKMLDAFGREITVEMTGRIDRKSAAKSVLACVAQSYELRIMMSVQPIIAAEKQATMLGWLHDGVLVRITNNADAVIRKMQRAIINTIVDIAVEKGVIICTRLNSELL